MLKELEPQEGKSQNDTSPYDGYQKELIMCLMRDEIIEEALGLQQTHELNLGQCFLAAESIVNGGECVYLGPGRLKLYPYGNTAHSPEDDFDYTTVIYDAKNY